MFEKDISQLAKPHIKGRGFIGSGNEIIETQTYYTQPENDWEFDDTQKLTYNNPVFTEQCKRRGIKVEDLDKGWVPQHKIGEETDDEVIDDDDLDDDFDSDDDDDVDETILFKSRPKAPAPPTEFKNESTEAKPKAPIKVEKPEVSMSDLEAIFGSSNATNESAESVESIKSTVDNNVVETSNTNVSSITGDTPNRNRINIALKKAEVPNQSVNVTYDKTSTDPGMAASTLNQLDKPKIKLNIKQKPPV